MQSTIIKKHFLIFILINIVLAIFWLDIKHEVENDSSISEWLINYQGGFTRRGLGGELGVALANLLDISLRRSIFLIQITIHSSYLALIYFYFKKLKFNIIQLFALYVPIFLLYPIAELEVLGRKEMLLFLFFLVTIFFSSRKYNAKIVNYLIFFISPIVCLIWEQVVLFFPFFASILIVKNNLKTFKQAFNKLLIIFFPGIITFIYIFITPLSGSGHEIMCNFLENNFGERCYMSASMLISSTIHFDTLWIHDNAQFVHYLRYILIFLIGFAPLNILVSKSNFVEKDNFITKNFRPRSLFFILYIPTILLFIYGYDWGRWINITYTFSILFYVYLLKNSIIESEFKIKNLIINKIVNNKSLILFIFLIFAFFWNPKTVITGDIATNTGYKIIYNTSKKIFNFGGVRIFQDNPLIKLHKKYIE
jgi:hypothetical protein|tara:strand:- start:1023 stop:2291 length:1269 start_codon:yes stop_codon:yes gene_type:complete